MPGIEGVCCTSGCSEWVLVEVGVGIGGGLLQKSQLIKTRSTSLPNTHNLLTHRLADLMEAHKEELAALESIDSGAVYTLALKTHVGMSIDSFRYFAGWCDKIQVCVWVSKL